MHFLILYEKVSKYTRDKMIILKDLNLAKFILSFMHRIIQLTSEYLLNCIFLDTSTSIPFCRELKTVSNGV